MSLAVSVLRMLVLAVVALGVGLRQPVRAGDAGIHLGPNGAIQHVIVIGFDNTHLEDIQQMPHLSSFLGGGALLSNDHPVLQTHTHPDFVSIASGVYPDRSGVPDQSFLDAGKPTSFLYWTNTTPAGLPLTFVAPPWKMFTNRGIAVGSIAWADMELERSEEVAQYHVPIPPFDTEPAHYLGVALHQPDGSDILGTPNLPKLYDAPRWDDPSQKLGAFPTTPDWSGGDAWWTLAATYELQRQGTPVTYTYISDAHDNRRQGDYSDRLASYDAAFAMFFAKLAEAGIDSANTLFVITTDEGDHYNPNGDRATSLASWLADNGSYQADLNNLSIQSDPGALVYLKNRGEGDKTLKSILASLKEVPGWQFIADEVALHGLHFSSLDDPARNPAFVLFGEPDVFYSGRPGSKDFSLDRSFLWSHGTISPDITAAWLGLVGPGVRKGAMPGVWLDHVDIVPTLDLLLGLPPTPTDGRAIFEVLEDAVLPAPAVAMHDQLSLLGDSFKQLNAPLGTFGYSILRQSTQASLAAGSPQGQELDAALQARIDQRDRLVAQIQSYLNSALAAAPADPATGQSLLAQAQELLASGP
ncbi:MAG: alkaline phosphatase family protein [Dehalococcoidia bacterium]